MGSVTTPGPQPINLEGVDDAPTFFDAVGGHQAFEDLVSGFYARVAHDPVLLPLYEGHELGESARRLQMFLEQYWGGPRTYSHVRGHPRLRARHAEFRIDTAARDAWLANMRASLDDLELGPDADAVLWDYLVRAADMLVNTDG
jgi:hemoglobin